MNFKDQFFKTTYSLVLFSILLPLTFSFSQETRYEVITLYLFAGTNLILSVLFNLLYFFPKLPVDGRLLTPGILNVCVLLSAFEQFHVNALFLNCLGCLNLSLGIIHLKKASAQMQ